MHHMREKTKTQFIKSDATGRSCPNTLVNNLPFEIHLPGHIFTCSETKLYEYLNPNGTPKEWSIPANRVDNAAYHHDLCYSKHDDTKHRSQVCDNTKLGVLNGTVNPTLGKKIDKSIVGKLTNAKFIFALGHPVKNPKIY